MELNNKKDDKKEYINEFPNKYSLKDLMKIKTMTLINLVTKKKKI